MPGPAVAAATFFTGLVPFRRWLKAHGAKATELVVGFHKVGSGRASITYADARDEALCWGWIDGIRRNIDEESYSIRFTPRKPRSLWSRVNVERVEALTREGRMQPPGLALYAAREEARTGVYAFEQREAARLTPRDEKALRANRAAWEFWSAQAPYYRRVASWWVVSAKKEETRARRLAQLIAHSAQGERLPQYRPLPKK
jgi:uncharacterized protein YdeI (YjbR/CyaY-like superfamily)